MRILARRLGAYLALAALSLQFALSFGHFHAPDISQPRFVKVHAIDGGTSGAADDEDRCSICLSSYLLSTSSAPQAPQTTHPTTFAYFDPTLGNAVEPVSETRYGPFQPRAPPQA